jgi:group I intron endonuclease
LKVEDFKTITYIGNSDKCGVYWIKNITNNKVYIGSAINFGHRKSVHFYTLRKNKGINLHLQRSFNKYKEDNFMFEILEIVDFTDDKIGLKQILLDKEEFWINEFNSIDRLLGYNIRPIPHSNLGMKMSEESKKKMSIAKKQQVWTEEWKRNMSIAAKNKKPCTEETKKRMSESAKKKAFPSQETRDKLARFGDTNPMYGRHHNKNTKEKIGIATAKLTKEEVSQIKTLLLKGFTYKEIAKIFNISPTNIGHIAREKTWKEIEPILNYKKREPKEKVVSNRKQLTRQQVIEIKKLLLQNIKQREIANRFNISEDVISSIKVGRSWSNIKLEDYINNNQLELLKESGNNNNYKLSNDKVIEIKKMLQKGMRPKDIAEIFNVRANTISNIKNNKTFSYIIINEISNEELKSIKLNTGEDNISSKLKKDQVINIKKLLLEGKISNRQIAKIYKVGASTIDSIKSEKTWSHIKLDDYLDEDGNI